MRNLKKGFTLAEGGKSRAGGRGKYILEPRRSNDTRKAAFTLAEVNSLAPLRERVRERGLKHAAFTLAEVLLVLGVVGVVAALTLPTLISNIHNKVVERQIQVIQRKINQGTEGMQVRGALLENYGSTSAFIDELSKDMKIISKCDSSHLTDCWPYDKITVSMPISEKEQVTVSEHTKGAEAFQMTGNWGEVMGIILGNGTPMLLSYNKNCPTIDPDSTYEVDKATGMSETSQCIAGVYDINGKRGPNKLYQDVIPFRANGYTDSYWFKTSGGKYFKGMPFVATAEQGKAVGLHGACSEIKSTGKYTDTNNIFGFGEGKVINVKQTLAKFVGCGFDDDRWLAGAVQCAAKGESLPDLDSMKDLASSLYPGGIWGVLTNDSGEEREVINGTRTIPPDLQAIIPSTGSFNLLLNISGNTVHTAGTFYFEKKRARRTEQYTSDISGNYAVCVGD